MTFEMTVLYMGVQMEKQVLTDTCVTHTSHNTAPDGTAIHSEKPLPSVVGFRGVHSSFAPPHPPPTTVDACGLERVDNLRGETQLDKAWYSGVCASAVPCHF